MHPSSIFEVVDVTDEEIYQTLGIFLSLTEARLETLACREPKDLGSDADHDDFCRVEIRERKLGWGGPGVKRLTVAWTRKYHEDRDEYTWTQAVEPRETETRPAAVITL